MKTQTMVSMETSIRIYSPRRIFLLRLFSGYWGMRVEVTVLTKVVVYPVVALISHGTEQHSGPCSRSPFMQIALYLAPESVVRRFA